MRLSVSIIEAYRLFRHEEWMTFDMFMERLEGTQEPTAKMLLGTALHAAAEGTAEDDGECYIVNDIHLAKKECGQLIAMLPRGLSEVSFVERMGGVDVSSRCDLIEGLRVHDIKTTEKTINPDKYHESFQWRLYLELFGCDQFTYHVVQMTGTKKGFMPKDYQAFDLYRYDGMREECESLVRECAEFVGSIKCVA